MYTSFVNTLPASSAVPIPVSISTPSSALRRTRSVRYACTSACWLMVPPYPSAIAATASLFASYPNVGTLLSLDHALNMDIPIPSLFETTTSISFPKEEDQVPIAFPAVAASHVAPAEFFISWEASSRTTYFFPPISSEPSFTAEAFPSTLVPTGSLLISPSLSTPVPRALRTPLVRAMESLCPISPIAST